jgi:menaquinone-9 beta-reductase
MAADAEVIVVGAGPAGASCAALLAERGHDVLLLDQSNFPRDKPCGDGLTRSAVAFLERMGLGELIAASQPIEGLRMVIDNGSIDYRPYTPTPRNSHGARCIPRGVLDEALLAAAIERDVHFLQARVVDCDEGDAGPGVRAIVDGQERTLRSRFVIAADGATSRLRRTRGHRRLNDETMAYAVRAYYRCERPAAPVFDVYMPLESEGTRIAGYGWVFPIDEHTLNVGVGYWRGPGISSPTKIRNVLDSFVEQLRTRGRSRFGDLEQTSKLSGSPLGVHFQRKHCEMNGVVFVGDAARTTDPWSGEGIAYALHGAETIAELVNARAYGRGIKLHAGTALGRRFGRLGQDLSFPLRFSERRLNHSGRSIESRTKHPFLRTVKHVIAAPEEESSLLDTPVGELVASDPRRRATLQEVNHILLDELQTGFPFAAEILHCKVRAGLGPIAAALTILCAGEVADEMPLLAAACALELISASAGPVRETIDRPDSASAKLNNALCVLITDFALSRGARQAVRAGAWMTQELSVTMKGIYRAQFAESQALFDSNRTVTDYVEVARARTSAPLALAARFASLLAQQSDGVVRRLGDFGWSLGLAVQICEDLQDLVGVDDLMGRTAGSDVRLGAYPLPVLYSDALDPRLADLLGPSFDSEQVPAILEHMTSTGAMERTVELARHSVEEAHAIITSMDGSIPGDLRMLPTLILERINELVVAGSVGLQPSGRDPEDRPEIPWAEADLNVG